MFFGEADAVRVHGLLHWRAYHHTGNLTPGPKAGTTFR
jgi:hypothetical protein